MMDECDATFCSVHGGGDALCPLHVCGDECVPFWNQWFATMKYLTDNELLVASDSDVSYDEPVDQEWF